MLESYPSLRNNSDPNLQLNIKNYSAIFKTAIHTNILAQKITSNFRFNQNSMSHTPNIPSCKILGKSGIIPRYLVLYQIKRVQV